MHYIGLPMSQKIVLITKELEVRRLKEEITLLEKEMGQYLLYYKGVVCGLKKDVAVLKTNSG